MSYDNQVALKEPKMTKPLLTEDLLTVKPAAILSEVSSFTMEHYSLLYTHKEYKFNESKFKQLSFDDEKGYIFVIV